jgi:hypothetical protein
MAIASRKSTGGAGTSRADVLTWESVPIFEGAEIDDVPDGWLTAVAFAELRGIHVQKAQRALSRMVADGIAETCKFKTRRDSAARPYPTPHFRLLKK